MAKPGVRTRFPGAPTLRTGSPRGRLSQHDLETASPKRTGVRPCNLPLVRLVLIAATVAAVVTGVHRTVEDAPPAAWIAFHAAVPAVVFSLGSLSTGVGRFGPRTVLRGLLVVAVVPVAFGWINGRSLPAPAALGLNFLVPLAVSTAGALSGRRLPTRIEKSSEETS